MAENDIYNNKARYESFASSYNTSLIMPVEVNTDIGKRKYYCKNKDNLVYFERLMLRFEAKDTSYIRRLKLLNTLKLIVSTTEKDLKHLGREDIDSIMAFMHGRYKSPKSKGDFIKDTKHIWKQLFSELDEKGRPDEKIIPYVVRHLEVKQDKSKEKRRQDKITFKDFERLICYFDSDSRIQAYLMLALESLGRPQELLYTRIRDYDMQDNYAKIHISEHGKEGIGLLQCIDSYPYVLKWYKQHPHKENNNAFFFVNNDKGKNDQLRPENINKKLRDACEVLKIAKVTCYSIKRNGVTFRRMRGDSDAEIQHAARWTSSKQLKTYDMSQQEDAFKIELIKRGLLDDKDKLLNGSLPKTKLCLICSKTIGFTEQICPYCRHIVDRAKIKEQIEQHSETENRLKQLERQITVIYEMLKEGKTGEIIDCLQ